MSDLKIPGGYVLDPRIEEKSWVAHAAPCTRAVWRYIRKYANWEDGKRHGVIVKRGQILISIKELQEKLHWILLD